MQPHRHALISITRLQTENHVSICTWGHEKKIHARKKEAINKTLDSSIIEPLLPCWKLILIHRLSMNNRRPMLHHRLPIFLSAHFFCWVKRPPSASPWGVINHLLEIHFSKTKSAFLGTIVIKFEFRQKLFLACFAAVIVLDKWNSRFGAKRCCWV